MENIADVDWGIVACIVHVLAVVVWVGGVWFVTAVVLPSMRKKPSREWLVECGGTPVCPASPRRRSAGPLERALHALSVRLVGPFCRCTLLVYASYGRSLAALCGPSLCPRAACRPPRHRSPRQCRTRRDAEADATFSCGHARAGSARDLRCRRRHTWALLMFQSACA